MNPEMMLAQLAPLREPSAIGWWPLALGWWILLGVAVLALIGFTLWVRKRRRYNHYRRLALTELALMRARQAGGNEINWLLKAAALRAFPSKRVANLHGAAWHTFLVSTCKGLTPEVFTELDHIYQPTNDSVSDSLYDSVERWIKHHEVSHA